MSLLTKLKEIQKESAQNLSQMAHYGTHSVTHGNYNYLPPGKFRSITKPVKGATATFESGADHARPTLTRIGAGAIIAGPAGAIVGGLFKKNRSKCYVTVIFADGDTSIIEAPAKHEHKLRQFAADVNRLAA